ncbi:MAG: hypothetical protein WC759_03925 [Candidatus Micrarchaeia archaeon]|jgi:ribosomal protein L31E
MANLERVYTIPLKKVFLKRHVRRGKYAIDELRAFGLRHMKAAEVKIGTGLSRFILAHGIKHPPRFVKVTAIKDEAGVAWLNLFGERPDDKLVAKKAEAPKKEEAHKHEHKAEKPLNEAEKKAAKEAIKAEVKK